MAIDHITTNRHVMHEPLLRHISNLPDRTAELLVENSLDQAECGGLSNSTSGVEEPKEPVCLTLTKVPKRNVPEALSPKKYYGWVTKLLLNHWLQKCPKKLQAAIWEIGYHISVIRDGPSSMAALMVLSDLQPNDPGLCTPAPDAWYRDWFGSLEDRRKAITACRGRNNPEDPNEERQDERLYGIKFLKPLYGVEIKSLIAVAENGIADAYSLVAMRRLVDKILNYPSSLQEAKEKQRILRIRTSPDHNHEMASENHFSKVQIYHYNKIVQELKKILDHEEYGEAIFRIPPGDLGIKKRHDSIPVSKKFTLVCSVLAGATCFSVAGLVFMFLL